MKRFTDPKLNAIRQALLAGNFAQVFSIAPLAWHKSTDAQERANFDFWNGTNALRKPLSLGDLRVKKINGVITKVPFNKSELTNYFTNYQFSKPGFQCTEEQIRKWTKRVLAGNFMYLYPSKIFCKPEKSSRRKKKIKKVLKVAAAVGVGVAAAVFLGPTVAGVAGKAGTAVGVGAGKIATGSGALIGHLNNARTIKAIVNGKMPPPPIDLSGAGFRDWAFESASNEIAEQYQRKLTAKEEKELLAEIEAMQRELSRLVPQNAPKQPNAGVPGIVQEKSAELAIQNKKDNDALALLAIAAPLAFLVFG